MNQGVTVEKSDARPNGPVKAGVDAGFEAGSEAGTAAGSGLQLDTADESPLGARVEKAYRSEKPRLMARVRAAGRTLEEAEDLLHDVYAEAMERVPLLPREQRRVVEAQVFGGMTFREIAEETGESIDTLTARKRYAVRKLSRALRSWIDA
jgi:DNA-directed RNA polymerase specialized sigma24 family protein